MIRTGGARRWILAALVAGPVLSFVLVFRPVREEVEVGYQGEARANPYLAAERLFTRMGVPAETVHGGVKLPPSGSTVVLLGPRPLPTNHDLDGLLDWIRHGGRLVATPAAAESFDPLLARFGTAATPAEEGDDGYGTSPATELVQVRWPEEGAPLEVRAPRGGRLVDRPEGGAGEPTGAAVAGEFLRRFEHGLGEVILVADGAFLRNEFIGRHDHARLAWALVRRETPGHPVAVLVVRDARPSLAALLSRHGWPALASGGLLLLAWLRLASARFGPPLPEPPRDRRRLLEHVEAAGGFLWQQGGREALLESTRRALLARIHRREPSWEKLPRAELVQRASGAAGLDPRAVEQALYGPVPGDAPGFVQSTQILETVRRSL